LWCYISAIAVYYQTASSAFSLNFSLILYLGQRCIFGLLSLFLGTTTGTLKTTLIQGNVKQDEKWLPQTARESLAYSNRHH